MRVANSLTAFLLAIGLVNCGGGSSGGGDGGSSPPATPVAEVEPNDVPPGQAIASLPAAITGTTVGTSAADWDDDLYTITLSSARNLTITLAGGTTQDMDLYVYTTGGALLGLSEGENTANESVTVNLNAGTYLVWVSPWIVTAPTNYTLNIP